jgi:tetratricopeptide (TPR) repeat protein
VSLWGRMKARLVGAPPPAAPPPPSPETETSVRKKKPTETGRRATRVPGPEPKDAAGWVERATELLRGGEAQKAVEGFTKAIELDATLAKAYAGRGVAYEALGRAEEAKADYKTSIGIELRGVLKAEYGYKEKPE